MNQESRARNITVRETRIHGARQLKKTSRAGAGLDADILLAYTLRSSREQLYAHDDRTVNARTLQRYRRLIARRGQHEPIAYLTKHKEFYGLPFFINKNVLIPRPETELLVELALLHIARRLSHIVIDVGTGSGAIAIAIAKNAPHTKIIATDISTLALTVARRNAKTNTVGNRITFRRSNLLPRTAYITTWRYKQLPILITANLPYLTTSQWRKTAPDVRRYEPRLALDGGKDGLRCYEELLSQLALSKKTIILLCEIDPSQKKSFPALVKKYFPRATVQIKNDLAHVPRVAVVTVPQR